MKLIFTIIFVFISCMIYAQQPCGTFEYESYLDAKFKGYSNALDLTRQQSANAMHQLNKAVNDSIYQIPVVFHVVWRDEVQNIDDSLIISQLLTLNESFNHRHKDTGKVRSIFKPVTGDARIEFYLANKDPMGKSCTGINRVKTTRYDFGESTNLFADAVKYTTDKGVDAWDPEKYLNIWVCKFTYNGTLAVSAYAYPPVNAKFWNATYYKSLDLQGVVVNYQFVGKQNPNDVTPTSIRERTLVHEVGHYLGLRHIWADKSNCTGEDDGFKDTPLSRSATTSFNITKNTCNEGTGDKVDMIENYMDYTPYPYTIMFTQMQIQQMRYNLLNLRSKAYRIKTDLPPPPVYTKISVAPNPIQGNLKIIFDKVGAYSMNVVDIIGQPVAEEQFSIGDTFEYNNPLHVASGIYYLSILKDNEVVLKQKILIQ